MSSGATLLQILFRPSSEKGFTRSGSTAYPTPGGLTYRIYLYRNLKGAVGEAWFGPLSMSAAVNVCKRKVCKTWAGHGRYSASQSLLTLVRAARQRHLELQLKGPSWAKQEYNLLRQMVWVTHRNRCGLDSQCQPGGVLHSFTVSINVEGKLLWQLGDFSRLR